MDRPETRVSFDATILVVDCASDDCSVALCRAGAPRDSIDVSSESVGQRHSQRALPMIDALLRRHGLQPRDCAGFGFGAGPGSFTGLRIACGLVQGLAFGSGRPVIAVGNLRALALAAAAGCDPQRVLVAIDARMQQVYWAVYERRSTAHAPHGQDGWHELAPPALADVAELPALCARWRPSLLAGNATLAPPHAAPDAAAVARAQVALAHDEFIAGRVLAPALAEPLYVRDRVAMTTAERRGVLAAGA